MLILQALDAHFFLDLLNGNPVTFDRSAQIQYLAFLRPGMDGFRRWAEQSPDRWARESDDGFPEDLPSNDRSYRQGIQFQLDFWCRKAMLDKHAATLPAVGALLREYVDQWIQSGYDEVGIETPLRRILPDNLHRKLNQFCAQKTFRVYPQKWGDVVGAWPDSPAQGGDFAKHEALRLMMCLLSSELKHTIAKCLAPHCHTYFERSKLQETFKRGAYCLKHSKGAGSYIERDLEKKDLMKFATKFWSQAAKRPNRALWVAGKINETRRGTQRHITQKWVSVNRLAIEKLLEEESHNA